MSAFELEPKISNRNSRYSNREGNRTQSKSPNQSKSTSEINAPESVKTKMVIDIHVRLLNLKVPKPISVRLIWVRNKN